MSDLRVIRRQRSGKDTLSVHDASGRRLARVDLLTGKTVIASLDQADEVYAAINRFCQTSPDSTLPLPGAAGRRAVPPAARPATFGPRIIDLKTDERNWHAGSDGSDGSDRSDGTETVGHRLAKLARHGWQVLHSVPVEGRRADLGHLLIGPGGVFVLSTRNHPGRSIVVIGDTVRVDGWATGYVQRSRHEGERAQRLLSVALGSPIAVRAVLVLLTGQGCTGLTYDRRPHDVLVLHGSDLPDRFRRAKRLLTDLQVATLHEVARRPQTWAPGPHRPDSHRTAPFR